MTAREMQVEFERIIILMNPEFELKDKLTSDTIFAFLNSAQERFIRNNYLQEDTVQDGTRAQKKNADSLKGLITRVLSVVVTQDTNNTDKTTDRVTLPNDYFLYIRSNSMISKNYKLDTEITDPTKYLITPNKTIREDDVEKIISSFDNRPILRNPYVVLNAGNNADVSPAIYLNVIHDLYTIVKKLDLVYYRKPKRFDVIDVDGINILATCELPENVHREIVELAVEMFITEAKYRLNMKQPASNSNQ